MASRDFTSSSRQQFDSTRPGEKICICYDVYAEEIIDAIKQGKNTVSEISDLTYACQGCGSCEPKIELLIQAYA